MWKSNYKELPAAIKCYNFFEVLISLKTAGYKYLEELDDLRGAYSATMDCLYKHPCSIVLTKGEYGITLISPTSYRKKFNGLADEFDETFDFCEEYKDEDKIYNSKNIKGFVDLIFHSKTKISDYNFNLILNLFEKDQKQKFLLDLENDRIIADNNKKSVKKEKNSEDERQIVKIKENNENKKIKTEQKGEDKMDIGKMMLMSTMMGTNNGNGNALGINPFMMMAMMSDNKKDSENMFNFDIGETFGKIGQLEDGEVRPTMSGSLAFKSKSGSYMSYENGQLIDNMGMVLPFDFSFAMPTQRVQVAVGDLVILKNKRYGFVEKINPLRIITESGVVSTVKDIKNILLDVNMITVVKGIGNMIMGGMQQAPMQQNKDLEIEMLKQQIAELTKVVIKNNKTEQKTTKKSGNKKTVEGE